MATRYFPKDVHAAATALKDTLAVLPQYDAITLLCTVDEGSTAVGSDYYLNVMPGKRIVLGRNAKMAYKALEYMRTGALLAR
jgi:hypothetical protein